MKGGIAHWDDVAPKRAEAGHIGGAWQDLGSAAGSVTVGLRRIQIDPGKWSTPAHCQGGEEEIFFALGGAGLSWQDGEVYEVAEGDCLVHLAGQAVHTLRAGPQGLEVLAFGMRLYTEIGELPRAGVAWIGRTWVSVGEDPAPWDREVAAGEPDVGDPSPRPETIVNVLDVPGEHGGRSKGLGAKAGAEQTGLNWGSLPPGGTGPPAHCHSAEEELFVVLKGDGTLELSPTPLAAERGATAEQHPVRAGSVVARPAGSRMAHAFSAGEEGLAYLAYGTRDPSDIVYYPATKRVFFRGIGLIAELDHVGYPGA